MNRTLVKLHESEWNTVQVFERKRQVLLKCTTFLTQKVDGNHMCVWMFLVRMLQRRDRPEMGWGGDFWYWFYVPSTSPTCTDYFHNFKNLRHNNYQVGFQPCHAVIQNFHHLKAQRNTMGLDAVWMALPNKWINKTHILNKEVHDSLCKSAWPCRWEMRNTRKDTGLPLTVRWQPGHHTWGRRQTTRYANMTQRNSPNECISPAQQI